MQSPVPSGRASDLERGVGGPIITRAPCCVIEEETFEPRHEKTKIQVSELVQHKPGCTDTEDG